MVDSRADSTELPEAASRAPRILVADGGPVSSKLVAGAWDRSGCGGLTAEEGTERLGLVAIACLQAGANDFVTKQVSREILSARIQTQLRLRALTDELRRHNDELGQWRTAQEADLAAAQATQQVLIPSHTPPLRGWTVQSTY